MKPSLLILFLSLFVTAGAQDFSGDWVGVLWQNGMADTFSYQMTLAQGGEAISGRSISANKENEVEFLLSGRWNGEVLVLQEVSQVRPSSPQWCLKYIQLTKNGNQLVGSWTAKGCDPGQLILTKAGSTIEEIPFTKLGRWSGHLTQSDREYGFYFEVNLEEGGTGTSHIVSEGAGGEATHLIEWKEENGQIICTEKEIIKRTEGDWKWCMKNYVLEITRSGAAFEMQGDWAGYLEHKTPESGACAPGDVFLNKPVLTRLVEAEVTSRQDAYSEETGRSVKVDRVIAVQSNKIRLKVWDNGIVDGDVITLFLNGVRIVNDYRVRKHKWSIPVTVNDGENLLILHAEDLGDISPNTVAVAIDDGVKEQIVIISSNLRESGSILIQPFVLEE